MLDLIREQSVWNKWSQEGCSYEGGWSRVRFTEEKCCCYIGDGSQAGALAEQQSSRACRKGQIGSSSRQESMAAAEAAEVMQLKRGGCWTSGRGVSGKDGRSGLQLIKNKPASNQQLQRQAWSLN